MRTIRWCIVVFALHAVPLFAAEAHLTFTRSVPPEINLAPMQRLALVEPRGSDALLDSFIDLFLEYVDDSGALQIEKIIDGRLETFDATAMRRLRRQHPADGYVSVIHFECQATPRSAEGSERDLSGTRVKRLHVWIDAVCDARLEFRHPDGEPFVSYSTHGDGTSPRTTELTADERATAYHQAARYAALSAADIITPRTVHDSIDLDPSAPLFDEGFGMIQFDRLSAARALWEAALAQHRDSAPLRYNLAALCEATGDFNAGRKYLQAAIGLAPRNRHYRDELEALQRRAAGK